VLLLGETGTGKGLLGRLLHRAGPRAIGPFVEVNCAAIPESLLEAELFGFQRGAFTGARDDKPGLFQAAHRGTLFLDEVGLLPHALQAKLLTAVESRQVRRLGSTRAEQVDVWIVAATNGDLVAAMKTGSFRQDLYHRIATVVLSLPPLRSRRADLLDLSAHFLARAAADHGVPPKVLSADAQAALQAHAWPGNVRELANVLERVTLLEEGQVVTAAMLDLPAFPSADTAAEPQGTGEAALTAMRDEERQQLLQALVQARGNVSGAAARLGMARNTLRYRMDRHGISVRAGRPRTRAIAPPSATASPESLPGEPPAIRWDQRLITVLGLRLESPPDTGDLHLASLLQELIGKATSFGGRVDSLTPTELVTVFGIEAVEDGPRRAVHAAKAMVRCLRPATEATPGTTGRFAIHLGRYLTAHGHAAAGLDARARRSAGEVLDALLNRAAPNEVVLDVAAARCLERRFALDPVEPGDDPMYRVLGPERRGFNVGGRTLSRFVGRAPQVGTLHELLGRAEAGEGQSVGLVGEPGVGKSRLVYEFRQGLGNNRVTCLEGHCVSHGSTIPFLPIVDLLRDYFAVSDVDTAAVTYQKVNAALAALDLDPTDAAPYVLHLLECPAGTETLQHHGPDIVKTRALETLTRLMLAASRDRPVLLVVEDLHWIDPSSSEALEALARGLTGCRTMLLTTYRPGYQAGWLGRSNASQLMVPRLSRADSQTVVRSVVHQPPEDLVDRILARGEGVPFFLEELARAAGEHIDRSAVLQVPDTVQGVLLARLDGIASEDRHVLDTAAVIGRDVPLPILEKAVEVSPDRLRESLGRLEQADFICQTRVAPTGQYTFRHALTHEVAYDSLSDEHRRAQHARIAATLEALAPDPRERPPEVLAQHHAGAGHRERAIEYWQRAGQRALDRGAYVEALAHIRAGLELVEPIRATPDGTRHELNLQLALGMGLMAARGYADPEVEQAFARARLLCMAGDESPELFPALFGLWRFYVGLGRLDPAWDVAMQLLAVAKNRQDPGLLVGAHGAVGETHLFRCELAQAREHLERAVALYAPEMFESHGMIYGQDPGSPTSGLLGWTYALQGDHDRAVEACDRAIARAKSVAHPFSLVFALDMAALSCLVTRDAIRAGRLGQEEAAIAHQYGFPYYEAAGRWFTGYALVSEGRPDPGIELMREGARVQGEAGIVRPGVDCVTAEVLLEAGYLAEAGPLVEAGLWRSEAGSERLYHAEFLRLRGELLRRQPGSAAGDVEQRFVEAIAYARQQGARPFELRASLGLARLWLEQGRAEAARELMTQLQRDFPGQLADADLHTGLPPSRAGALA
jgi:predicted ATPase